MAVTAQIESNNTENVFWALGRVPMFTFDMDVKSCIFAHFGVILLSYLFVRMYISYKAHNRFTKETFLIVSDVDVNMFPALRSTPSCTTVMYLRSCILSRHKMRQSQIATYQESLQSHIVIWRILWSWPWRPWVQKHWKRILGTWESTHVHFWQESERLSFDLFSYYLPYVLYIIHQTWVAREWTSGMCLITLKRCSRYLEYYCCKLLTSFRDFGFEPLLKCLSAHITCEKIRWCCWNHVRTDAVNNSHISIHKIKGQHIYRNWLNICH